MALLLEREAYNGVIVSYHRIYEIANKTNESTGIQLYSYIDESKRELEAEAEVIQKKIDNDEPITPAEEQIWLKGSNTFKELKWYMLPEYVEDFTVTDGYNYLKTLPEFKGAIDC